jgi:hypothetical protein
LLQVPEFVGVCEDSLVAAPGASFFTMTGLFGDRFLQEQINEAVQRCVHARHRLKHLPFSIAVSPDMLSQAVPVAVKRLFQRS